MTPKKETLLKLSTELDEPSLIEIDGEEYEVYGANHVGKAEEIKLVTLFRRYERLSDVLSDEETPEEALEEAARGSQNVRYEIIGTFTNVPREVIERIPLPYQGEIMNLIAKEMGFTDDNKQNGAAPSDDDADSFRA